MYRRLLVLALGAFAVGTDSFVIAGLLPDVSRSLHVSTGAAGQLITAYALAYAVLSPVLAALTASWPRRTVLLTGLAVFVVGTAASALLSSYAAVLAGRALAGAGGGMTVPTAGGIGAGLVPERLRGRALSIVLAGLTAATALGSPLGTAVAAVADWRTTLLGVAGLGLIALAGVAVGMPSGPGVRAAGMRARLAPVRDRRVAAILATSLLAYAGLFSAYSYIAVVLHPVTGGDGTTLAVLLLAWGLAATAGNLAAGNLSDRFGGHRTAVIALLVVTADFVVLPWGVRHLATAVIVLVVWGVAGWGLLVAQQHRLVGAAPAAAPLVIALNSTATYAAVSASGAIGAAVIATAGAGWLGPVAVVFLLAALAMAFLGGGGFDRTVRDDPRARAAGPVAVTGEHRRP